MKKTSAWLGCGVALLLPAMADAHGKVVASTPAEGATLTTAPRSISLRFNEAVKLTALSIAAAPATLLKLPLPTGKPQREFTLTPPALAPGATELHWRAMGDDGHVVSGTLHFTIAAAQNPAQTPAQTKPKP